MSRNDVSKLDPARRASAAITEAVVRDCRRLYAGRIVADLAGWAELEAAAARWWADLPDSWGMTTGTGDHGYDLGLALVEICRAYAADEEADDG